MASITPSPGILASYSVPCSLYLRGVKKEDLFDLPGVDAESVAYLASLPAYMSMGFLTDKKNPLRPHDSFLNAAHRYGFIPSLLRSGVREYRLEDVTYTAVGPSHLLKRLSERASIIFQQFLLHECHQTHAPESLPKDVICTLGREVRMNKREIVPGEIFDITAYDYKKGGLTNPNNIMCYEKPIGFKGVAETTDWLIVVITRGKDELAAMPVDSDFGIGCRNVAETVNNVCGFLGSLSPSLNLARRTLLHAIEYVFLKRHEIALHLKAGNTHLLRHPETGPYKTTVGIVKNEGGGYPWRAFVILSQKTKYPLLGKGADSVVTLAAEVSASPQICASVACYGDYEHTVRAIRLHQEFAPFGAVQVVAHFPPYNKTVVNEGKKSTKNVVRILQELYQKNLMVREHQYFKDTGALLPFKKTLVYTHFILRFLKTFHERGLAHRDIKASNILFKQEGAEEKLAITDFVRSCFINDEFLLRDLDTTHVYIDPSMAKAFCLTNGSRSSHHYAFIDPQAADVWATGITLLTLMLHRNDVIPRITDKEWLSYKDAHLDMNPDSAVQEDIRYAYAITLGCTDRKWVTRMLKREGYLINSCQAEELIEGLLDPNPLTRLTANAAEAALAAILKTTSIKIHALPEGSEAAKAPPAGAGSRGPTGSTATNDSMPSVSAEEEERDCPVPGRLDVTAAKPPLPSAAVKAALMEETMLCASQEGNGESDRVSTASHVAVRVPAGRFANLKGSSAPGSGSDRVAPSFGRLKRLRNAAGIVRALSHMGGKPLLAAAPSVSSDSAAEAGRRSFPLFALTAAQVEPGPGNTGSVPDPEGTVVIVDEGTT